MTVFSASNPPSLGHTTLPVVLVLLLDQNVTVVVSARPDSFCDKLKLVEPIQRNASFSRLLLPSADILQVPPLLIARPKRLSIVRRTRKLPPKEEKPVGKRQLKSQEMRQFSAKVRVRLRLMAVRHTKLRSHLPRRSLVPPPRFPDAAATHRARRHSCECAACRRRMHM